LAVATANDDHRAKAISSEYQAQLKLVDNLSANSWKELASQINASWIWVPDLRDQFDGNPREFAQLRRQLSQVDDDILAVSASINRHGGRRLIPGRFFRN